MEDDCSSDVHMGHASSEESMGSQVASDRNRRHILSSGGLAHPGTDSDVDYAVDSGDFQGAYGSPRNGKRRNTASDHRRDAKRPKPSNISDRSPVPRPALACAYPYPLLLQ